MAKREGSKFNNCSPDDVFRLFRKLGGFYVKEGGKHTKVTHIESGKATLIPRAKKVNRHLLNDVIDKYLIEELGYKREDITKNLTC